jgi:hypothetical protein
MYRNRLAIGRLRRRLNQVIAERNHLHYLLRSIGENVAPPEGIPHLTYEGGVPFAPILAHRPIEDRVKVVALLPPEFFGDHHRYRDWKERLHTMNLQPGVFDALPRLDRPATPVPRHEAADLWAMVS